MADADEKPEVLDYASPRPPEISSASSAAGCSGFMVGLLAAALLCWGAFGMFTAMSEWKSVHIEWDEVDKACWCFPLGLFCAWISVKWLRASWRRNG